MENSPSENFEQLPLAKTEMPEASATGGQYRVYSDDTNFKTVQAVSAANALELSGLSHVFKIVREALHKTTLIVPKMRHHAAQEASPAAQEAPAAQTAPVTETAAPAAEAPPAT